jgi:uncharacterized protein with HEPN domain
LSSDDLGLLRDIVFSGRRVLSYVAGMQQSEFDTDPKTQDAVIYRLGVVGEAARWLSDGPRRAIDADWPAIISMRNRLFHGYAEIRLEVVWQSVTEDLSTLIENVERYLS